MVTDEVRRFLEAVGSDGDLRLAWRDSVSPAAAVELAAERGFTFTEREIVAGLAALQSARSELSEQELEGVAGGLLADGSVRRRDVVVAFPNGWRTLSMDGKGNDVLTEETT